MQEQTTWTARSMPHVQSAPSNVLFLMAIYQETNFWQTAPELQPGFPQHS
jgi:hypothetical protein